jgi:hypothetical protein
MGLLVIAQWLQEIAEVQSAPRSADPTQPSFLRTRCGIRIRRASNNCAKPVSIALLGCLALLIAGCVAAPNMGQSDGRAYEQTTSNGHSVKQVVSQVTGTNPASTDISSTPGSSGAALAQPSGFSGIQNTSGAASESGAAEISVYAAPLSREKTTTQLSSTGPIVRIPVSTISLAKRRKGESSNSALSSLTCAEGSITGAGTETCMVELTAPAVSALVVGLSSSEPALVVPASVTVVEGGTSASFQATVSAVNANQTATLTASAGGVSKSFAVQLDAALATLSLNTSSLSFGNVNVNTPSSQTVVLSSTGSLAVTVNAATVAGSGFSVSGDTFPLTLNPNQKATLTVQFDPASAGAMAGQLAISSNSSAGTASVINLAGTGIPVLTGLGCANNAMTGAGTDNCTVTLNAAAVSGGFAVTLASNNNTVTVPASVTVVAGASTASFTATASSVSSAQTVTLTASAANVSTTFALQLVSSPANLSINASTVTFGNVSLNTPATQSVVLTSSGTAAVTVNSATAAGSGFTVSGPAFPLGLSPNQTATLTVQFDPSVAGAAAGSLTIVSTSSTNPTATVSLSGTGVATSYEVQLSWDAPASSPDPVAGYNVYRSPSGASSYIQVNSSAVTQTAYTDSSVQNGQSYDYVVESVDASGVQSAPSNIASAVIP